VAVCANRMMDYEAAKAACEHALDREEGNAKALYFLAKAIEGEGEYTKALGVLSKLLKASPQHVEGRKLHAELKMQVAKQKAQLNGMFERAQKQNGEGLYTEKELMKQRKEERSKKEHAMHNPEIYTDATLANMDPVDACKMMSQFQAKYENEEEAENERKELFGKLTPLQQSDLEEKYRNGANYQDLRKEFWKGAIEDTYKETTPRSRRQLTKDRAKMFGVSSVLVLILSLLGTTAWTLVRAAWSPLQDFVALYLSFRFF